ASDTTNASTSLAAVNANHSSTPKAEPGTAIKTEASAIAAESASLDAPSSSDIDDSGEDSKKNHLNLFTNFSKNVKTKSATMIRKLQRPFDGSNSNRSSTEFASGSAPPESKMKTAL